MPRQSRQHLIPPPRDIPVVFFCPVKCPPSCLARWALQAGLPGVGKLLLNIFYGFGNDPRRTLPGLALSNKMRIFASTNRALDPDYYCCVLLDASFHNSVAPLKHYCNGFAKTAVSRAYDNMYGMVQNGLRRSIFPKSPNCPGHAKHPRARGGDFCCSRHTPPALLSPSKVVESMGMICALRNTQVGLYAYVFTILLRS